MEEILIVVVGVVVIRLSDIIWSAQSGAVKLVMDIFGKLIDAVEKLCDNFENIDTRGAAQIVMENVCDYLFLTFLYLWSDILKKMIHTQLYL